MLRAAHCRVAMSREPQFYADAATVPLDPSRPLLIVDADEVLLRFAEGFDRFLQARGLYLDLVSYRLHSNVKRREDQTPILDIEVTGLLDEFRDRSRFARRGRSCGGRALRAADGTRCRRAVECESGPGAAAAAQFCGAWLRHAAGHQFRSEGTRGQDARATRRQARILCRRYSTAPRLRGGSGAGRISHSSDRRRTPESVASALAARPLPRRQLARGGCVHP